MDEDRCKKCNTGFYVHKTGACSAIPAAVAPCTAMEDFENLCKTCSTDSPSGISCCPAGEYYQETGVETPLCLSVFVTTQTECSKYSENTCTAVGPDRYMTESNNICKNGDFYLTNTCADTATLDCKYYNDDGSLCIQPPLDYPGIGPTFMLAKKLNIELNKGTTCNDNQKYFNDGFCSTVGMAKDPANPNDAEA